MLPRTLIGAMSPQMSVLQRFGTPALDLNLAGDSTLDTRITATRASTKTYFDSTGTMQTAAVNEFPREYDPSTLVCLGRSFWEARTNSIRNNTMQGAFAGTPGTSPTNWVITPTGTGVSSIIGTGTESGISYIDVRFVGAAGDAVQIRFEGTAQIAAVNAQTWTSSFFVKLAGGSYTNCTTANRTVFRDGGGAALSVIDDSFTATSAGLATQRDISTNTGANASIAFITNQVLVTASGGACDITIRIGMPQLELGATVTPVIATTSAAATRAADVVSMTGTNFSSWYGGGSGTVLCTYTQVPNTIDTNALWAISGASAALPVIASRIGYNSFRRVRSYAQDIGAVFQYAIEGLISSATSGSVAVAFSATNDMAQSENGGAVQADTSGTIVPSSGAEFQIGKNSSTYLNGWLSRITYWNRRLSNADLQILSRST